MPKEHEDIHRKKPRNNEYEKNCSILASNIKKEQK
jgi:hypothetical protein